jgi:predicted CXXCH cytochrome family protein
MIIKAGVRLLYGLALGLALMLITFFAVRAEPQTQESQPNQINCTACHESFQVAWEDSAHGRAGTSQTFQAALEGQENPSQCMSCHVTNYDEETHTWEADGITCTACHDTSMSNHPMQPMAADRSAKMCGECHNETYFEWQVSSHRASGLDCVGCHDPHATSLKGEDSATQCASCHRTRASNFAHSEHSQQGLTCADCHLAELPDLTGEGHARLDHSFNVRLSTCNSCHAYQMHDPSTVHPERSAPLPVEAFGPVDTMSIMQEPDPVSPVGFATLAGLVGIIAGVILAPWLDRWHRSDARGKK